jgi:hypothetical protein
MPTLHEIALGTQPFGALESVLSDWRSGVISITFECYGVYESFKISLQKGGTNFRMVSPLHHSRPRPPPSLSPSLSRGGFFPRRS